YLVILSQLIDPSNPSVGTFKQRVFVSHLDFSAPVVLVTEGYIADYASRPKYVEELAGMFGTNQICVEHRYFGKSVPENKDWKYLTAENAAYDHHHVIELFKTIYSGKWISTGISKGGQTTLIHRTLYPNDVDISVPYVAPLNFGVEDGRHEKFIDNVSTLSDRKKIREFQLEVLKRRKKLTPLLERFCAAKHYTFNIPMSEVYDFCVLEYSFAFWQWGTPIESIPTQSASDADVFNHFVSIAPPDYFSNEGIAPTQAFFVQAASQLGYYGYETKPFSKYLKVKNTHGYLARLFLPEGYSPKFDSSLSLRCVKFLKEQDPKMIFIYGEYDPWFASAVEFNGKTNLLRAVVPGGSHLSRIHSLPPEPQKEVIDRIKCWLNQNATVDVSLDHLQKADVQK
ncbi:MAG: S28 family serine protease, partial [Bacteroidota bacterium]|nr:S28 family serine protease [Bacteroidota bacterium]